MSDKHHDSRPHRQAASYLKRKGALLAHGLEHEKAHRAFSRRDFMQLSGLLALGSAMPLGGAMLQPFLPNAMLNSMMSGDCGDRVLVLVRMKGGNDGLNMVIQRDNDEYYNIRPTIAVPESGLWGLSDAIGMPNEMDALRPFWEGGHMQVIHNVGYPDANYSHFRSSDIWASASDSDDIVSTGWIGRWLDQEYAAFSSAPPVVPPALQIGVQTDMVFRGAAGSTALSISNPREFYQIALNGELYDTQIPGSTPPVEELRFVRSVANSAFRYSETIRDAYNRASNQANYPDHNLGNAAAIIARLIKGNLGSKVYMISIDGFDTHADQANSHPYLLQVTAQALAALFDDLRASGHSQNVLAMTFSEFGRTIFENGSAGTDHGTGAPMLVLADDIGSGFHGQAPDLVNVDDYGDPFYSVDFRTAYATVLQNWLCLPPEVVGQTLGQSFPTIEGLLPPSSPPPPLSDPGALLGHRPGTEPGTIDIRYSTRRKGHVRLMVLSENGTQLRLLVDEFQEPGSYTFQFRPATWLLSSGNYRYRLETGGRRYERTMRV